MKKLLLIDGSNLIFRAYYGTENINVKNPQNISVNAVYGLINMLSKILEDENPTHVFIALDRAKKTFRHEMYDDYKGGRASMPDKLREQWTIVQDFFDALGIIKGDSEKYEADDLIATYANIAKKENYKVKIISGDKDLLQLVDENVNVLIPKMGFAKECDYDVKTFEEKYEFSPKRFIEYKALVGDKSDNIIGIEKLGDKTAKKIINNSKNIEDIINQAQEGEIKGKVGENINNNLELIKRNLVLVTLIEDTPLDVGIDELKFDGINLETYGTFLQEQGFTKIYNNLLKSNNIEIKKEEIKYIEIEDFKIDEHIKGITYLYTQNLKENYFLSECLGIGIVNESGNFYLSQNNINDEFIKFLESDHPKVYYNSKNLLANINKRIKLNGTVTDLYLALALINSDNYKKTIDQNLLSYEYTNIDNFEEIYKAKSNPKKPEPAIYYEDIVKKTIGLSKTHEKIVGKLIENKSIELLEEIELPLLQTLSEMEKEGIYIDKSKLIALKDKYSQVILELQEKLEDYALINFNSFIQLSNLLFEEWNLPKKGIKKTTTAYSTDEENLNKLLSLLKETEDKYKNEITFINLLLEYRKTNKLLNTYVKNIEKFILADGRVHPINHQLLAETGRLSVMDPSIQNMPIRTELGQEIRSIFKNTKGIILAFDYSQIELRVMAHFSKDEAMIEAFNNDVDIHTQTAKKILGSNDVTALQRSQAKAINFGIIYGMSSYGLAKQVGISNQTAKEFIEKYFLEYPNIKSYMDEQIQYAKDNGYVKTLFGRKREIPTINSKNYKEKEMSARMAINTPIQGTAADIMKMALIKVNKALGEANVDAKIIMQIHDEIVLDVNPKHKDKVIKIVKENMEDVVDLEVKLKVDYGEGDSWLDAK